MSRQVAARNRPEELNRRPTIGRALSGGSRIVVRGNFFDMPVDEPGTLSNAPVFAAPDFGPIDDVLIECNWLNGGNYSVFLSEKKNKPWTAHATHPVVRGNRFGRRFTYGPKLVRGDSCVWENNR